MTPGSRLEQLTDAVDALLARDRASASEGTGGESGDEAVRDEASVLAAAFSELRAAHDGVDAPFVFDPQASERSRRRVMVRGWRVGAASLAAAAVALVVLLPEASEDTAPQLGQLDFVEPESATRVAAPRPSWMSLVDSPGILDVRTPRLAIVRPVPSTSDDLGGDVRRRPQRARVSTASFTRLKTARLSTTNAIGAAPSSLGRSPSMIPKPRRKYDDDNADDDLDRGGSSDRQLIGLERLG